jgi:aspartate aminotransferase-like enzyme
MDKKYLLTPGPTPVPPSVSLCMANPIIHHRTMEYEEIFSMVRQGLKRLFQTKQDVLVLSASGTGAMDAAVSNLLSPGDKALVVVGGKFGQRWADICRAYQVEVESIEVEWGQAVNPDDVAKKLKQNSNIKAVFTTYSETSTGVLHDIKAIAEIVAGYPDTVIVVDAITALGVLEVPMDNWSLDVVVSGSQKAFMMPPGLSFIALSQKAWKLTDSSKLPKYYFNLKKERKAQDKNQSAYTPAISLVIALQESLRLIEQEGLKQVFKRHRRLAEATQAAIRALGLELFAPESPSPALTAVKMAEGIDVSALRGLLSKKYGVTIAGGQDHLKGKIFRIAHLGYMSTFDVITAIAALEMALYELGYSLKLGSGVCAAQQALIKTST